MSTTVPPCYISALRTPRSWLCFAFARAGREWAWATGAPRPAATLADYDSPYRKDS